MRSKLLILSFMMTFILMACGPMVSITGPQSSREDSVMAMNLVETEENEDMIAEYGDIIVLMLITKKFGSETYISKPIASFRYRASAFAVQTKLNNFLTEQDLYLDSDRSPISVLILAELVNSKLIELDLPISNATYGSLGCEFLLVTIPLKD